MHQADESIARDVNSLSIDDLLNVIVKLWGCEITSFSEENLFPLICL